MTARVDATIPSAADASFANALADLVAKRDQDLRAVCPDDASRLLLALSDAVRVIIIVGRSMFEATGMSPDLARERATDMVAHALGEAGGAL